MRPPIRSDRGDVPGRDVEIDAEFCGVGVGKSLAQKTRDDPRQDSHRFPAVGHTVFPVGLMDRDPDGSAITVFGSFKYQADPVFLTELSGIPSRSFLIFSVLSPLSRLISPGCGVRINGPLARDSSAAFSCECIQPVRVQHGRISFA